MKRLFKWALGLALAVLAAAVILFALKNVILRAALERRIRARTGLKATIGGVSSGLFARVVTLRNLELYNPASFGGAAFLKIAELRAELDPAALARRQFHLKLLRLDISELDVVRNRAGQTNIINIIRRVRARQAAGDGGHTRSAGVQFTGVDELNLRLGEVKFLDLGNPRRDRSIQLGRGNQVFKNVNSSTDLDAVLLVLWLRSGGKIPLAPADFARHPARSSSAAPEPENPSGGAHPPSRVAGCASSPALWRAMLTGTLGTFQRVGMVSARAPACAGRRKTAREARALPVRLRVQG